MALLFPWATKEYLLWKMTLGQIIMYRNHAINIKNGKGNTGKLSDMNHKQLSKKREEMIQQGLIDKEFLRQKYGDI